MTTTHISSWRLQFLLVKCVFLLEVSEIWMTKSTLFVNNFVVDIFRLFLILFSSVFSSLNQERFVISNNSCLNNKCHNIRTLKHREISFFFKSLVVAKDYSNKWQFYSFSIQSQVFKDWMCNLNHFRICIVELTQKWGHTQTASPATLTVVVKYRSYQLLQGENAHYNWNRSDFINYLYCVW